jgi:hypothetical protein
MSRIFRKGVFIFFVITLGGNCFAQKQLILLKGDKLLLRLNPGDDIVYRLKSSKDIRSTYINNLSDTAVVTHSDTVPYHHIDRIYFKRSTFANKVGWILVVGGTGFFLIDQFNSVVVDGNKAELDEGVTTTSLIMIGAGLPLILTKKNNVRMGGSKRLLMVAEGSPFYYDHRPKGYISPYIPR